MSGELVEIVRCKDCIHRPIKGESHLHDVEPPRDSRGYEDYTCPCLNVDDYWYLWYPSDDWFCAAGEEKRSQMIHSKISQTLYTEDYKTAVNISEILNSYYDRRIENIIMVNEENFNNGSEMTVETEHYRWVIEKK